MAESSLPVPLFWLFSGVLYPLLLFDLKRIFCVRLSIIIIEYLSIDKKKKRQGETQNKVYIWILEKIKWFSNLLMGFTMKYQKSINEKQNKKQYETTACVMS